MADDKNNKKRKRPRVANWVCDECTFENPELYLVCGVCEGHKLSDSMYAPFSLFNVAFL